METNQERAKRIINREAARNRNLIKSMESTGVGRKDWTRRQVKDLKIAMRKQQLEVLEELQGLFD
jgi:hypothetical protein